jgi:hypothetical protein
VLSCNGDGNGVHGLTTKLRWGLKHKQAGRHHASGADWNPGIDSPRVVLVTGCKAKKQEWEHRHIRAKVTWGHGGTHFCMAAELVPEACRLKAQPWILESKLDYYDNG